MMSDSEKRDESDAGRNPSEKPSEAETVDDDRHVGRYTEVDGEEPLVRDVPGEYTRSDGVDHEGPGIGDYVSTQEHPHTHDPSDRPGKYARADHGKPHEHKHHDES